MKRCIFHYPHPIENKPGIGSALRPNRMRAAFENIGYQVDEVSGYGKQRKDAIDKIKHNIESGIVYDFVYSESVNIPMMLAEQDHLPRYPFLDFSFFKFCRKHKIPVGLFYRDMHWRFSLYRKSVSIWKQMITQPLFRYDLSMYRKHVDILYVPSLELGEFIQHPTIRQLPPGGQEQKEVLARRAAAQPEQGKLRVFYVGNVLGVYDVTDFCKAVANTPGVYLTICTPQTSWEAAKHRYQPYLCDRIKVVHKSSDELQPYYEEADVFCCCLENNEYTRMAMPIKAFESISFGVPVLVTEGIVVGRLIEEAGAGWTAPNDAQAFSSLLDTLLKDSKEVQEKTKNVLSIAPRHTWECRAQQVADDLTSIKGNLL